MGEVCDGEGRRKRPQALTDPAPFLFGRKGMVGREMLPVGHCHCGLPDITLCANTRVLRETTFLPCTWNKRVTNKSRR